jgi:hypothetical protein
MPWVICMLVIHSAPPDKRDVMQVRGHVVKEFSDSASVYFGQDFQDKKVDFKFNPVFQLVNLNDCLYESM